ncbi:hypothetical protein D0863_03133 [Hortaea werneckii]|uniref:Uncharacterized protein n=1 Tax=Hortaea werneckii TaxID=91943 RepID=A0A3M7EEU9_HORWE|nr:hypothetical protein D0863_03133 [Hortaea werneckii]
MPKQSCYIPSLQGNPQHQQAAEYSLTTTSFRINLSNQSITVVRNMSTPSERTFSQSSDTRRNSISISSSSGHPTSQTSGSEQERKSSFGQAMEKAKARLSRSKPSNSESLPDDEADFEKQKAKDVEKQKRKEEYERLGLKEQTTFGLSGAGGWKAM